MSLTGYILRYFDTLYHLHSHSHSRFCIRKLFMLKMKPLAKENDFHLLSKEFI